MGSNSRKFAWLFLVIFIWNICSPVMVYAGGGGPTQPEVQGFTPIGLSDMVDPFTGDFTYNIPLMDVEGYPINIAYSSGVTMDQEASWVGLGWNLHTGAVVRNMRGIPDDFNGDQVIKTVSQKPTTNLGVNAQASFETFGFEIIDGIAESQGNLNAAVDISYNNYTGVGVGFSFGPSYSFGKMGATKLNAGFSISGSDENGAGFAPSLSLEKYTTTSDGNNYKKSISIGSAFNSRAGLTSLSFERSISGRKKQDERRLFYSKGVEGKGAGSLGLAAFDLGLNSYTPQIGVSMTSFSISGSATFGVSLFGQDPALTLGINYSRQWIPDEKKTLYVKSYGYFNHHNGQGDKNSLLDFNRDNDGSFTKYSRDLPSAFQTYDLFSVQAQGTGGSFRGLRNDIGYVYDNRTTTDNYSGNIGLELGLGNLTDFGADVAISIVNSWSGLWSDNNSAKSALTALTTSSSNIVPSYSMIEAGEASVDFSPLVSSATGGSSAQQFDLTDVHPSYTKLTKELETGVTSNNNTEIGNNQRSTRILTNNQLYFRTNQEVASGLGIQAMNPLIYNQAPGHHIGEVTQLGADGRRYIFGLPAYNRTQEDVTFAVGDRLYDDDHGVQPSDDYSGIIDLGSSIGTMASTSNDWGIDEYYSSTVTPPYAHSYLLTSILSDDYMDADLIQGPSVGDLGSYVKIDYTKVENHKWRTPMAENSAYFNEGMKTTQKDDKASFVYGEKDMYYVQTVETKNYIAVFETIERQDGKSANGRNGGLSGDATKSQRALKKIKLYAKANYGTPNAKPLQEVEFFYDYSLCQGYPGNPSGEGKLTLKKITFSYQGSNKMKNRSYSFEYNDLDASLNPNYNLKAQDRWGSYKALNGSGYDTPLASAMTNADFPYVNQDKIEADKNAKVWSLTGIVLPSGGKIHVTYESDDYGYVQHKKAERMFKIVGVESENSSTPSLLSTNPNIQQVSSYGKRNRAIYFEMDKPTDTWSQYCSVGQQLYFRVLVGLDNSGANGKNSEYVSGYGTITSVENYDANGKRYGRIQLQGEALSGISSDEFSPICKAAILFGRMQLSRTINNNFTLQSEPSGGGQALMDIANSLVGSITSLQELFTGPNIPIYEYNKGRQIVVNKSFIRLLEPDGTKLGGGSRVKEIRMYDNWNTMTNNAASGFSYGQQYDYTLDGVRSSGVASYEPQLGGDENPFHTAYVVTNKKRMAMDDKLYIEDPIMESQFPSPSIGYSKVTIMDLPRAGVTRTATGKIVKEFYTARDFPTLVSRSDVEIRAKNSFLPFIPKYQLLTATQGFTIELNDMHGKPRAERVYGEGQSSPLSTVEYIYQTSGLNLDGAQNYALNNTVQVIQQDGSIKTSQIGVRQDAVADFRESNTDSKTLTIQINSNSFLLGFLPLIIPAVWPKVDQTTNQFRSATLNKTIQRFGILKETRADQDGSKVNTFNLAYDAQTGEVLSTQTTTNFNDAVYSMNYPAYWSYPSFGQASKNINYYIKGNVSNNGFVAVSPSKNYFTEGDEVSVTFSNNTSLKAWVVEKDGSGIRLIDKAGNAVVTSNNVTVQVIRSGFRNKQNTSMASLTSLGNPLNGLQSNNYLNVLNAGAVEFSDSWNTYCDCFQGANLSTNPYIVGTKGNWRPIRSYTHLSGRTQSNYNGNTNIRRDGTFTSYSPFYRNTGSDWTATPANWTFVSEVTEFSPNGMTLETKDALGRYSSSTFGFNNTLTTGVAANTKSRELAVGNFEDIDYTNCMDQGFFNKVTVGGSQVPVSGTMISRTEAHTGRNSIKVTSTTPVKFSNVVSTCDPQNTCNLSATDVSSNQGVVSYQGLLTITGGTPGYTVDIDALEQSDAFLINGNQIQYSFDPSSVPGSMMTISVIDSNGCLMTLELKLKNRLVIVNN